MEYNFQLIENVITRREIPEVIPLYEHFVDDPVIEQIMGYNFSEIDTTVEDGIVETWKKRIEFYRQMGYVYVPVELGVKFAPRATKMTKHDDISDTIKRNWVDEREGPIQNMDDLHNPEYWPDVEKAFDYELFERIADLLPQGMKIIGGASGGPFEHASFLMGLESLCIAIYENPELVQVLFEKIGKTLVGIAERLVKLDKLGAYRFGDDLGYKNATMISPDLLRKYVFPWQKRVVEALHKAGKPFVLHSCGQLEAVMEDLINDVKIHAKHSFEDVILPVTEAKKRWGHRIAILGGIDVDFLCRSTTKEIKEHTKKILEVCSKGGGYAAGSGNTITSYMPPQNYLAMLDAVREFNGM